MKTKNSVILLALFILVSPFFLKSQENNSKAWKFKELILLKLYVLSDIVFSNNSDKIFSSSHSVLNKLSTKLSEKEYKIIIFTHINKRGSARYNQKLTQKQAESLKKYLINNRKVTTEVYAYGLGDKYNSTYDNGMKKVVEIVFLDSNYEKPINFEKFYKELW